MEVRTGSIIGAALHVYDRSGLPAARYQCHVREDSLLHP